MRSRFEKKRAIAFSRALGFGRVDRCCQEISLVRSGLGMGLGRSCWRGLRGDRCCYGIDQLSMQSGDEVLINLKDAIEGWLEVANNSQSIESTAQIIEIAV